MHLKFQQNIFIEHIKPQMSFKKQIIKKDINFK